MKTHRILPKDQLFTRLLPGFFFAMMLVIGQACSDPISTNETAFEAEAASQTTLAGGTQAGQTDAATHSPPDGDYPDPNRPGNVIICHVPSDDPDHPVSLSILPADVANYTDNPNNYDGPCTDNGTEEGDGTNDEGEDDQDDPNAQPIEDGDDNGGDDDGTLDGDYPDPNRPGNVIICHVPSDDPDHPVSLSILPADVANYTDNPNNYDGPCTDNGTEEGDGTGDEGENDQDDPNAAPVGGDDGGSNEAGNLNDGRGSAGL